MEDLITLMLGAISVFGIWWLYFIEYQQYRLDKTRQELFTIRDELFSSWDESKRSFDEPAYGMMRTTLNGMTRFTHKLSAIRLFAAIYADISVTDGEKTKQYEAAFNKALGRLELSERKTISNARNNMHEVIIRHMLFSSLILMCAAYFVKLVRTTAEIQRIILNKKRIKEGLSMIDAEAERIGHHHLVHA